MHDFLFQENPSKSNRALHQVSISPIWVPPAPPKKKMAKRCKKDQRNPLSWWIFGKLNTRCTKLLCMPQHLEPPLTKSSTQRGPRHSANEQPVKIQWVLKTHGVLFVEIQENPPWKPMHSLYIYIYYILCLHFGSFLVNVGYCTYSILYIGSYGTKVGTATIDRKYIKWSMCNCYVSSQHKCIQEKWEHMTCDVWTTVTLCDIPEHTKTTWIRNGMPPPLKCPGRES